MTSPGLSPFPADALEANRAGKLTDAQRRSIRGSSRGFRKAELQFAVVMTVLGLLIWFAQGPAKYANVKPLVGIACLVIAGALVVRSVMGADRLTQDARSGRVESVEGAIAKRAVSSESRGSTSVSYYFEVAGKQITVSRSEYEAGPEAGYVKVYFLPHSHELVNMERLPDHALPPDAFRSPEVAREIFKGMRSHDPIQAAEAMAQGAAMEDALKATLKHDPAPPHPPGGGDARPLGEAIIGSWSNQVMSVSFGGDGAFDATLPGGTRRSGHWSVDGSGNFVSDLTGPLTPSEVWINGDELTVTVGGTGMTFQRDGR